ncbi:MAG: hypothetical protein Q8R55_00200 [Candidatus Taylorbacteria bacterium]|nr:hypothetical protein [Candidatus Taylorbacteria bacterium]
MENPKEYNHYPNKIAHLQMIQGVIDRMGGNLFYLRGWVISLAAGGLVLLTQLEDGGRLPIIFLGLITLLFWAYDGYFLSLERNYRKLYDKVRMMDENEVNFSMNIRDFKRDWDSSILACIFSPTLRFFYSPLLFAILYVIFFIK